MIEHDAEHFIGEKKLDREIVTFKKDGKDLDVKITHEQPIFFAPGVNELRDNVEAQRALKKYRVEIQKDDFIK